MVEPGETKVKVEGIEEKKVFKFKKKNQRCLLYTSDAADD